jgi:hypothetical protein
MASWHAKEFEETCAMCKHPLKVVIEGYYLRAYRVSELADLAQLDQRILRDHFDALGLTDKRADNTDAFYARIIDLGLEELDSETAKLLLMKALERKDKVNGREVLKVQQMRPTKIIIMAPPQTFEITDKGAEARKEVAGEVVRLLGPGDHGKAG